MEDYCFDWKDNEEIIYLKAANFGKPEPVESIPPFSPSIHSNLLGNTAAARTYQSLLKNKFQEEQFVFYTTSTIYSINIYDKIEKSLSITGIINKFCISPDGSFFSWFLLSLINNRFGF